MEDQNNFLLDWSYFCHGKSTEELTESLIITSMELEAARFKAQEALKIKDYELIQLKHLLNTTINEKNEAQNKYQTLLQYHNNHRQTLEDEYITNYGLSSSDCEESIVSSSVTEPSVRLTSPAGSSEQEFGVPLMALPEKGKLLEAVIKAGPLLQNLLIAGPLPHWRNPPPVVDSHWIPPPPVVVPSPPIPIHELVWKLNKKRGNILPEGSDSSTETKYQRININ